MDMRLGALLSIFVEENIFQNFDFSNMKGPQPWNGLPTRLDRVQSETPSKTNLCKGEEKKKV